MPQSFASLLSWFTAFAALVFAALGAIELVRGGWSAQGVAFALTPPLWILLCAITLKTISKRVREGAYRAAGRALILALMPIGAVFGLCLGGFSGLGASYGNGDAELARNFVMAFALGVALALIPSLIIAAIALSRALIAERSDITSTPGS